MKREDAIKLCRYYHGEKECPLKDDTEVTLWSIERMWVDNTITENDTSFFSEILTDYLNVGLKDFHKFDDVPVTLKAFLLNRCMKYDERIDIDKFKKFYEQYYS